MTESDIKRLIEKAFEAPNEADQVKAAAALARIGVLIYPPPEPVDK